MRYYISDCHFGHENMNTRMDTRGFASAQEMDEYMIKQWNKKVRKNDEVVILGDLSWGDGNYTNTILKRLNGRKFLIKGNHDRRYLEDKNFDKTLYERIESYAEINDNNKKIICCHYPVFCYNGQYRKLPSGEPKSYMLYGHVHDTQDQRLVECFQQITKNTQVRDENIPCNMINCFCMYSDYTPLTLDEWIAKQK